MKKIILATALAVASFGAVAQQKVVLTDMHYAQKVEHCKEFTQSYTYPIVVAIAGSAEQKLEAYKEIEKESPLKAKVFLGLIGDENIPKGIGGRIAYSMGMSIAIMEQCLTSLGDA